MLFQEISQNRIDDLVVLENLSMNTDTTFPYTKSELLNLFEHGYKCYGIVNESGTIVAKVGFEVIADGFELDIMTHPDYQNKGIGRRVMSESIDHLINISPSTRIILKVHPDNEHAVHLYSSQGFTEIDRIETDHGPRIVMQYFA